MSEKPKDDFEDEEPEETEDAGTVPLPDRNPTRPAAAHVPPGPAGPIRALDNP